MHKVELLAPVGSKEALIAAISAGADAVYLSGVKYGARAYANNFELNELVEAFNYAHLYDVKVYVTINTLISEDEIDDVIEYVKEIYKAGVDALIIQDLGLISILRQILPDLELHASTQMHIHNLEGIKVIKDLGLTRAVLARETPLDVIKSLAKEDIELEIFVHGALCVSYSGQCLFSSLNMNRSGNKGECAQPCRMKYSLIENDKVISKDKYLLSTKDLNTLDNLNEILDTNIDSIKIEGRMKRPEYVYYVVSLYRKAIDEYYQGNKYKINKQELDTLKTLFNREFTKGFIFNANNSDIINHVRGNHLGISLGTILKQDKQYITIKLEHDIAQHDGIRILNNKEDQGFILNYIYKDNLLVNKADKGDIIQIKSNNIRVNKNDKVVLTSSINDLNNISNLISNSNYKTKINLCLTARINQEIKLEVRFKDHILIETGSIVEQAKTSKIDQERIIKQLNKFNDTSFKLDNIKIDIDDNVFISIKELNDLRRNIIKRLELDIINKSKRDIKEGLYTIDTIDYKDNRIYIVISNYKQYEILKDYNYILCTYNKELYNEINNKDIIYINSNIINTYSIYNKMGISEIGGLNINPVISMPSLNIYNSYSIAYLNKMGVNSISLSYELGEEDIRLIVNNYYKRYNKRPNINKIIYGRIDIMTTKYCVISSIKGNGNNKCLKCKGNKYELEDIKGNKYPVITDDNCNNHIMNKDILNELEDIDKYEEIGVKDFTIILDNEDKNTIMDIINSL